MRTIAQVHANGMPGEASLLFANDEMAMILFWVNAQFAFAIINRSLFAGNLHLLADYLLVVAEIQRIRIWNLEVHLFCDSACRSQHHQHNTIGQIQIGSRRHRALRTRRNHFPPIFFADRLIAFSERQERNKNRQIILHKFEELILN